MSVLQFDLLPLIWYTFYLNRETALIKHYKMPLIGIFEN